MLSVQQPREPAVEDASAASPNDASVAFGNALVNLIQPLRHRAYRLTRDAVAAEDLLQETMIRAWSARQSFRAGTNLQAWTYTILRNLHLSTLRRSRRTTELSEHMTENLVAIGADQYQQAELTAVLEAINQLPEDQRSALRAVSLEGLDYASAASKLNVSQAALKSRVHRARLTVMRMINEGIPKTMILVTALPVGPAAAAAAAGSRGVASVLRGRWAAAKLAGQPLWIG